jgi:hypothetical protein
LVNQSVQFIIWCYSHFDNGLCNKVFLMITKYKVNPIGRWRKIPVTVMGFASAFGVYLKYIISREQKIA